MSAKTFKKIEGFDGIRGLAVLSVVFSHLGLFSFLQSTAYLRQAVLPLVYGPTGVQAFFVLSGFLITMLLIKEFRSYNKISIRNFYYRRILRIIPLYLLFLIIVIIIHLLADQVTTWKSLLFASTYIYNFIPKDWYSTVLGHTWSLAVEEHFYLIWPILFSMYYATRRKGLLVGLIAFILVSYLSRVVLGKLWWLEYSYFIDRWSIIAGSNIALGCLCAILIYDEDTSDEWRRIFGHNAAFALGALLFLNSLLLYAFHVSQYLRGLGIALVISWVCLNQSSKLTSWLEYRPLQYIGLISYGIYIYQGLFLGTGPARSPGQDWPPDVLLGLALLVIAAPLSYHFFEKPFLSLKNRFRKAP